MMLTLIIGSLLDMSSQDSGEQSGTRQHTREAGAADNGRQMHAGHQQGEADAKGMQRPGNPKNLSS